MIGAPPLFARALGSTFDGLPPSLRRFHSLRGVHALTGRVDVAEPTTIIARLLARCLGTPRVAGTGPLRFELNAAGDSETWTRRLPGTTMVSRLFVHGPCIEERIGPVRLCFVPEAGPDRLVLRLVGLRVLGVPCPRRLLPRIVAEETASADRVHFTVRASLAGIGTVAGYRGHLDLPPGDAG
jgi:hypothetical protein